MVCDVYDPDTNTPYHSDPRGVARRATDLLKSSGIADTAYFGPEAEFFVFDSVEWSTKPESTSYKFDSYELPSNTGKSYDMGNTGHRPAAKGGYFPAAPVDALADLRSEMVSQLHSLGIAVEKHHHEVAPAQCELGIKFADLMTAADSMQVYKYVVKNVADSFGKTATFMPKPMYKDNGSGMHVHQSLWKAGKPLFAGNGYAGLSETCLHYIGGMIKHAHAINAFTNPTTNSYKRLVPGYEAPVNLAYSSRNRSAAIRIPFVTSEKARRIEVRFPDPTANVYLAFSAMLMAGIDGIKNKINPGQATDENLYEMEKSKLAKIPTVAPSLASALDALEKDKAFLLNGDVFTEQLIASYISMKRAEVERVEQHPHPAEFDMYYSR